MDISISGRHCTVPEETKADITRRIEAIFSNMTLKVPSAKIVLDLEKSTRFGAEAVIYIKDHPIETKVEGFDSTKVIDEMIDKLATQARKYMEKKQERREPSAIKEKEG